MIRNRTKLPFFLVISLLCGPLGLYSINAQSDQDISSEKFFENVRKFLEADDDLGLRIYIQNNRKRKSLSVSEWSHIRTVIHNRPHVGYDLLYNWDRNRKIINNFSDVRKREEYIRKADEYLLKKKWSAAYDLYEKIAKSLYSDLKENPNENIILYYTILRNMARAMYSMGNFRESLQIYQWIKPNYPRYRQILFEQTWAAFRAGYVDRALGSIASQKSGFFAEYLEPESYLLQIYLYKKLCRQRELRAIIKEIFSYKKELETGKYTWKDWAKSDVEYRTLLLLVEQENKPGAPLISSAERTREVKRISSALRKRFRADRNRTLKHIKFILAQAKVTVSLGSKKLVPVERLPTRQAWFDKGLEVWPNEKEESWYDELGRMRFMGENECQSTKEDES